MISELYIEGQKADVTTAMSSMMNFAIDDIKDFSERSTAYSKTIVLPGSLRNNILFGNIFDVAISNDYDPALPNVNINYNASALANCLYFQDFIQVFKGTIRILQINIDRGRIDYEVAISGEITKLNSVLTTSLLEDLDFSAYDLTYDETNIVASWDNPGGTGVYFPLIDYGTYSVDKHNWDFRTFRPALYVREYIDKMLTAAGFRWDSALFDTARFKGLVIPHNQKEMTRLSTSLFQADIDPPFTASDFDSSASIEIPFPDVITAGDFTPFTATSYEYNGANIDATIQAMLTGFWSAPGAGSSDTTVAILKNGSPVASTFLPPGTVNINLSAPISLTAGDVISVFVNGVFLSAIPYNLTINTGSFMVTTGNLATVPVQYGETITINDTLPKNVKQIDFLVSIVKLFNLYVYEDRFDERLLHIAPYVDFFSVESQNAVDWTYKLARDKAIKIQPLSEINAKVYNFKYAADSDYYNDLYKKRYNLTYGSYIFDTEFDFVSNSADCELIFASTPLVGYTGEDKVYPTIFKLNDTTEERIDSVIRIMQTKKITGVTSWDIKDGVSVLTSLTDYGYAGHFDDPDNVTNDLNFGAPEELFFLLVVGDLTVTQFNVYWSAYMAEITDKDSKLLTAKFYLTPKDILELDFSKYVHVDGNLYRLNKINNYNLTKPDLCDVQLLKVINTLY